METQSEYKRFTSDLKNLLDLHIEAYGRDHFSYDHESSLIEKFENAQGAFIGYWGIKRLNLFGIDGNAT